MESDPTNPAAEMPDKSDKEEARAVQTMIPAADIAAAAAAGAAEIPVPAAAGAAAAPEQAAGAMETLVPAAGAMEIPVPAAAGAAEIQEQAAGAAATAAGTAEIPCEYPGNQQLGG